MPTPVCIGQQTKGCTPVPRCDGYLAAISDTEIIYRQQVLNLALCQRDREEVYKDAYTIHRKLIERVNESAEDN